MVEGSRASVIGGAEIYRLFLPLADRIELTEVHGRPEGDTVMPPFAGWREAAREDHEGYSFVTLVR
jgi:dihydrofolate reductase